SERGRWSGRRRRRSGAPEQALDALLVAAGDLRGSREAAGALGGLLLEQVGAERLAAGDLARPGHLEALGGAPVGLHLRHHAAPFSADGSPASCLVGDLRPSLRVGCSTMVMLRPS